MYVYDCYVSIVVNHVNHPVVSFNFYASARPIYLGHARLRCQDDSDSVGFRHALSTHYV